MNFKAADKLVDKIVDFLIGCGGVFDVSWIGRIQHVVILAVATKQYVIKIKEGEIVYFTCWWYFNDADKVDILESYYPEIPKNITVGNNVYIAQTGVKSGFKDMEAAVNAKVKRLATSELEDKYYWHNGKNNQRLCVYNRSKNYEPR